MSNNVTNKPGHIPTIPVVQVNVKDAVEVAGAGVERAVVVADHFETATSIVRKGREAMTALAGRVNVRDGNLVRAGGAVVGAIVQRLGSPQVVRYASGMGGFIQGILESKAMKAAGIASIAWSAYKDLTEEGVSRNSKVANSLGTVLAAAGSMVVPGLLAAEVLTGGGVTGAAKGLMAVANSVLTGDSSTLEKWNSAAREGEHGWAVKYTMKAADAVADSAVGRAWSAIKVW